MPTLWNIFHLVNQIQEAFNGGSYTIEKGILFSRVLRFIFPLLQSKVPLCVPVTEVKPHISLSRKAFVNCLKTSKLECINI